MEQIRFITPDLATVDGSWTVTGARGPEGKELPPIQGRGFELLQKKGGQWRFLVTREMALFRVQHPRPGSRQNSSERVAISRRSVLLVIGAGLTGSMPEPPRLRRSISFLHSFNSGKETKNAGPDERTQRFLELVVQPHADLFEGFTGPVSTERAGKYLARVEPLVAAIETLHTWAANDFDRKVSTFKKELPEFHWRGSVVFMPNLFGFDAGTGEMKGKELVVFGLDTIAEMDGPQGDLSVLITHELFHLYHAWFHPEWKGQTRGKDIPLYRLVWAEGLATYASQELNPKAKVATILRSPTLAASCQERLKALARLLQQDLDSSEKQSFMEWMSGQARSSDVPPRAGYYLGWRVAQEMGRKRSLRELAHLSGAEVRSAMAQELGRLERWTTP